MTSKPNRTASDPQEGFIDYVEENPQSNRKPFRPGRPPGCPRDIWYAGDEAVQKWIALGGKAAFQKATAHDQQPRNPAEVLRKKRGKLTVKITKKPKKSDIHGQKNPRQKKKSFTKDHSNKK